MKLDLSLSNLVTKAARVVTRDYQKECAPLGVTPSQAGVVYILSRVGPSAQVEIAAALKLDKTNVNAMVRKLQSAGYLAITKDAADSRRDVVALTGEGVRLAAALREVDARVGAKYDGLAGADSRAARDFLERIVFGE